MNGSIEHVKDCLSKLEASLQCSICLNTFDDPIKTRCGHNFCSTCIKTAMNGKGSISCPLCKAVISKRNHTKTVHLEKVVAAVHSIHNALEDVIGVSTQNQKASNITTETPIKPQKKVAKNALHPKAIFPKKDEGVQNFTPDMLDAVDEFFVADNKKKKSPNLKLNPTNSTPEIMLKLPCPDNTNAENRKPINHGDPFLFPDSQKEKAKSSAKKGNKKAIVKNCGNKRSNISMKSAKKPSLKTQKQNKEKSKKIEPMSPQDKEIVQSIESAEHHQLVIEDTRVKKLSMSSKKTKKDVSKMNMANKKPIEEKLKKVDSSKQADNLLSPLKDEHGISEKSKKFAHVHWKNSSSLQSIIPDNLTEETPECDLNSELNKQDKNKSCSSKEIALNDKTPKKSDESQNLLPITAHENVCDDPPIQNDSNAKKDSKDSVEISPSIDKYIAGHPRLLKRLIYSTESSSSSEQLIREPENVIAQTSQIGFEDKVKTWLENIEPCVDTNEINSVENTLDMEAKLEKALEDHTSVSQISDEIPKPEKKVIKRPIRKRQKRDNEPKLLKQNIFNVEGISQGVSPFSSPVSKSSANEDIKIDDGTENNVIEKEGIIPIGVSDTVIEMDHGNNNCEDITPLNKTSEKKTSERESLIETTVRMSDKKDDYKAVVTKKIAGESSKITYVPVLSTQPSENTSVQISRVVKIATGVVHRQDTQSTNLNSAQLSSPKTFKADQKNLGSIRLDDMPIICVAETEEDTQKSTAYFVESPPESTQPSEKEKVLPTQEKCEENKDSTFNKHTVELGLFDFSEPTPTSQSTVTESKVLFNQLNDSSEKILETSRLSDDKTGCQTINKNVIQQATAQCINIEIGDDGENELKVDNKCWEGKKEVSPIAHKPKGLTSPNASVDEQIETANFAVEPSRNSPEKKQNIESKIREDVIENSVEEIEDFRAGVMKRREGLRMRKMPRINLRARNSKVREKAKKEIGRKPPEGKNRAVENNPTIVKSVSPDKMTKNEELKSDWKISETVMGDKNVVTKKNRKSSNSPGTSTSKPCTEDMVCTSNGWGGSKLKIRIFRTSSEEEGEREKSPSLTSELKPLKSEEFLDCGASGMIQEYIKNREQLLSQSAIHKKKLKVTARKTTKSSISAQKLVKRREKELRKSSEFGSDFDIGPFPSSWPKTSTSNFNFDSSLPSCGLLSGVEVVINRLDDKTISKYTAPKGQDIDMIGDDEISSSPLLFQSQGHAEESVLKIADHDNAGVLCSNKIESKNGDLDFMSYLKEMETLVGKMEKLSDKFKKFDEVGKFNQNISILKLNLKDSISGYSTMQKQTDKSLSRKNEDQKQCENNDMNVMQINEARSPFDNEDMTTISSSLPQNKDISSRPKKHRRKSTQFPDVPTKVLKENIEPPTKSPNPRKRSRDSACTDDENERKKRDSGVTCIQQLTQRRTKSNDSLKSQTSFHTPQSMMQNSKSLLDSEAEKVRKEELVLEEDDRKMVIQDSPTSPPPECYSDEDYESTEEYLFKVLPETEVTESKNIRKSSPVNNSEVVPASFTQTNEQSINSQHNEVDDLLRRISEFTCEMSEMNTHNITQEERSKIAINSIISPQTTAPPLNSSINITKTPPHKHLPSTSIAKSPKTIIKLASTAANSKSPISISNENERNLVSLQSQKAGLLPSTSTDNKSPTNQTPRVFDEKRSQIENIKPSELKVSDGKKSTSPKARQNKIIDKMSAGNQNKSQCMNSESTTMSDKSSQQSTSLTKLNLGNSSIRGERKCLGVMASGLQGKALDIVKLFTKKFKGSYYNRFEAGNVTHLIVKTNNLKCSRTLKYLQALGSKIWVLDIHWAIDSLKNRKLLPRESYEVTGEVDHNIANGPKTCRLSPKTSNVLTGFHIHCVPPFSAFSTRDIEELCQLGGAQVVKNTALMNNTNSGNKILIFDIDAYDASIPNYAEIAQQCGSTAVSYNWLCECIATNSVPPLSEFPVEEFDSEFSE